MHTGIKAWTSEQGREGGGVTVSSETGGKVFYIFAPTLPLFAGTGPQNGFKPPFGFLDHKGQPQQLGLAWL